MVESVQYNPAIIQVLQEKRQEWKIADNKSNAELIALAGSAFAEFRDKALSELEKRWNLLPERTANSEKVKKVDLMEQFEQIPEYRRTHLLRELVALQLVEGCNGGCEFCLFGIKEKGITHKYTFDSLEKFFTKYGKNIGITGNNLHLYWDSDPFDYKDGDKTFLDIYRLAKNTVSKPEAIDKSYISTSVPRGSQKEFSLFVEQVINNHLNLDDTMPEIRLSIRKSNIERVETALEVVWNRLIQTTPERDSEKLRAAFQKLIVCVFRDDSTIQNLGPLISKAERFKDIGTIACADGVVLSPDYPRNVAVTAATPSVPSGQFEQLLDLHDPTIFSLRFVDMYSAKISDTNNLESEKQKLNRIINYRLNFIPEIQISDQDGLRKNAELIPKNIELSRDCKSMQTFIDSCTKISDSNIENTQRDMFMKVSKEEWDRIRKSILGRLDSFRAKKHQDIESRYITELDVLLISKVDFIFNRYLNKGAIHAATIAQILNKLGDKQAPHVDRIMNVMDKLLDKKTAREIYIPELEEHIIEVNRYLEGLDPKPDETEQREYINYFIDCAASNASLNQEDYQNLVKISEKIKSPQEIKHIINKNIYCKALEISRPMYHATKKIIEDNILIYWDHDLDKNWWANYLLELLAKNILVSKFGI
jgi:hypothetical protein